MTAPLLCWLLIAILIASTNLICAAGAQGRGRIGIILPRLTRRRIAQELSDITRCNLTLATPFNASDKAEEGIRLSPLRGNLLEWHFSMTGLEGSAFEGGVYHGVITLDPSYPNRAPSISLLTSSGRWEVGKPICLSATSYHQESWDRSWTLRTLLLSLRAFMVSQPREIGAILRSVEVRKSLAVASRSYHCPICNTSHIALCNSEMPMKPTQPGKREHNAPRKRSRYTNFAHMIWNTYKDAVDNRGVALLVSAALIYALSIVHSLLFGFIHALI